LKELHKADLPALPLSSPTTTEMPKEEVKEKKITAGGIFGKKK
jgi:hypothetical protein